jgi:hypothetical protein
MEGRSSNVSKRETARLLDEISGGQVRIFFGQIVYEAQVSFYDLTKKKQIVHMKRSPVGRKVSGVFPCC